MKIDEHVRQYPRSVRILFLSEMLRNAERFQNMQHRYPVELMSGGWCACFYAYSSDGFTLQGYIEALWSSL